MNFSTVSNASSASLHNASTWHSNHSYSSHAHAPPEPLVQSFFFYLGLVYIVMMLVVMGQLLRVLWFK